MCNFQSCWQMTCSPGSLKRQPPGGSTNHGGTPPTAQVPRAEQPSSPCRTVSDGLSRPDNEQLGKLIADALMLKGGGTAVLPVRLLASGTGLQYNIQC